ncbi:MAG: 2-hydroxychromene-2-carboxylate isomerase [Methylococcaceae bacterium]|nr:2-hydroxychromene-2-carboxylate isomerase [Methylococcaceae bacterium]
MDTIDFYFDFLSPYAYLASRRIEAIAKKHGRRVQWHPFRLGIAVVKVMGLRPVMETPLKGPYAMLDVQRLAKVMGEPLCFSGKLPDPLPPAKFFYCIPSELSATAAKALLNAQWEQGRDIGRLDTLKEIGVELGFECDWTHAAVEGAQGSSRLREATDTALARGVFGSPTCVVDDALFWGVDRLWLLDWYLENNETYKPLGSEMAGVLGLGKERPGPA